jgi:hypothetical protein
MWLVLSRRQIATVLYIWRTIPARWPAVYLCIVEALSLVGRYYSVLVADDTCTSASDIPISRLASLNGQQCCVFRCGRWYYHTSQR